MGGISDGLPQQSCESSTTQMQNWYEWLIQNKITHSLAPHAGVAVYPSICCECILTVVLIMPHYIMLLIILLFRETFTNSVVLFLFKVRGPRLRLPAWKIFTIPELWLTSRPWIVLKNPSRPPVWYRICLPCRYRERLDRNWTPADFWSVLARESNRLPPESI